MKKTLVIFGALILLGTSNKTIGQGKLAAIKEKAMKIGQVNVNGDPAKLAEDSTSTVLEGKTIPKDPYNVNGIYYSQKPIFYDQRNEGEKSTQFKKFLITHDDKLNAFVFTNRLSTGMDYTDHKYHTFRFGNADAKDVISASYKKGVISSVKGNYGSNSYYYYDKNLQSSYAAQNGITQFTMASICISLLEPGIFVMHDPVYLQKSLKSCEGPGFASTDYDEQTFNLIYQAGKDISKYTPAVIKAKLFELALKQCEISRSFRLAQNDLPKTIPTINEAPSQADMMAAVNARAKQFNYSETIKDVRFTEEWVPVYENLGTMQLRTLTGRKIYVVVTMNTEKGNCTYEIQTLLQRNNYVTGSIDENYKGKKVEAIANGPNTVIECSKIK